VPEFILVDLYSQRHAVVRYVLGWSIEAVLQWVGCYGYVSMAQPLSSDRPIYFFRSFAGLTCPFCFDDNRNLTVLTSGWFYG
jgi:hypothetical protein